MIRRFLSLMGLIMLMASSQLFAQQLTTGYVTVSHGQKVYYESVGQGEPVVLLHGHTLDHRMWAPQVECLRDRYNVICIDFRGYGLSDPQLEGVQFTHLDDVVTVLDSLHLDKVHLVGLSQGSFVASEFVALHPERLKTALLASGNIRKMPGPSTPFDSLEIAKTQASIAAVKQQGVDQWKQEWIEKLVKGGGSNAESIRESLTQQVMDWNGWQLLHQEMRLYYANEAWDTLRERCPEVPTLILSGENEGKGKNPMLQYLPNSRQVIIPDCGHMSNMERPEEFNRLMLELLTSTKGLCASQE